MGGLLSERSKTNNVADLWSLSPRSPRQAKMGGELWNVRDMGTISPSRNFQSLMNKTNIIAI
jgi:hypothetical protein